MKRRKIKYLILFLFIAALISVAWYFWFNPKKALNFALPNLSELSYVNAKIHSDTAYVEVIGVIENKAPYKITIDSLVYKLELAGVTIISERQRLDIKQLSGEKDTVVLTFRIPISKTRDLIKKLQVKDSTTLTGSFEITYNTIFGRTTVPFSKEFNIKVPTPPEITLNEVKRGELNLRKKNIDIELDISIKNNSDKIELKLRDLVYHARLGQYIKGSGRYNKPIVIKPSSSIRLRLPINVVVDKPFKVLWKVITNKDLMNYNISVDGILQNEKLEDVPISITASGRTELKK